MSSVDVLVFSQLSDGFYVGTNKTDLKNGLKTDVAIPSKIVIPYKHDSNQVDYIGQYAFSQCQDIVDIIIKARLKGIHYCAFFGCQKLKSINIPSTCEFINASGIDGRINNTDNRSKEHLVIFFESFSVLNYFGKAAICNFGKVTIYFPTEITATCHSYFLHNILSSNIKLYSKHKFDICNFTTITHPIQTCKECLFLPLKRITLTTIVVLL